METPLNLYTKTQVSWYIIKDMYNSHWAYDAYVDDYDVWFNATKRITKTDAENGM